MIEHADDPFALISGWMAEAETSEPNDPNAMALATVGADGMPSVRMVLLKGFDAEGFVFYTNLESRKGEQLRAHPKAALCLHWKSLRRSVRAEGLVSPVSDAEADAYFAGRPRSSRIGAWASRQSRPLAGRFELERRVAEYTAKFGLGDIPRPPFWSGFKIAPLRIEFWKDGAFRLHDRLAFRREAPVGPWTIEHLFP
ncbi:MAG TPA: pyridoxamine 5'-phosphate oxidase [Alphaproteobacteria bacterium]|nr:pyridoxamine 5'-phosphate oxidase [Alphaproteobacteria bacterium]